MLGFAAFAEALERRARARRFGVADTRAFDIGFPKLPLCGAATSPRSQRVDAGFAFRASRCDEGRSLIPSVQCFHAQPQIVHVRIDCVKGELRTHDRDTSRPFTFVCTLERRLQTKAKRNHAVLSRRNVNAPMTDSGFARLPTSFAIRRSGIVNGSAELNPPRSRTTRFHERSFRRHHRTRSRFGVHVMRETKRRLAGQATTATTTPIHCGTHFGNGRSDHDQFSRAGHSA